MSGISGQFYEPYETLIWSI